MQNGMLLLPFLSIFSFILAVATSKAYKDAPGAGVFFFVLAAALLITWLVKDKRGLLNHFRHKGAKHGLSQGLTVLLAIVLAVGLGFLTQKDRFNKRIDITRDRTNTLSQESIKLVEEVKKKGQSIKIIGFFQSEEKKAEFRKVIALYQSKGLGAEVEYVDPQTDPTRAIAENITTADTVMLKGPKQEARVSTFSEEKLTNGLVRVLKEKERKIYFLGGHGEAELTNQEPAGYSTAKAELESERFSVAELNLYEVEKVPDDADLLVIAGPKYDLKTGEVAQLKDYLKSGKPLLALVDALVQVPNLNSVLSDAGIRLNDDLLIIRPDDPRAKLLGQNNAVVTEFDKLSPVTADFVKRGGVALMTPNTRSLEIIPQNSMNLKVAGLAKSSEINLKISDVKTEADLKIKLTQDRLINGKFDVFAVAHGPVGGKKVASASSANEITDSDVKTDNGLTPSKELRVFVGGSSHLASNLGSARIENMDLFINAVSYLTQDEDFISVRVKDATKSVLNLTSSTSQFLLLLITWVYPFVFLGVGTFYWLRRRQA